MDEQRDDKSISKEEEEKEKAIGAVSKEGEKRLPATVIQRFAKSILSKLFKIKRPFKAFIHH